MGLDLSSIRYVVFDEADRLFEMGFAAQLTEILHALPQSRQTLLFSATLPKSLVEFARAGLQEPNLVRLDAESKISPDLQSAFFTMKSAEKEGALMHILNVGHAHYVNSAPFDVRQFHRTSSKSHRARQRQQVETKRKPVYTTERESGETVIVRSHVIHPRSTLPLSLLPPSTM